MLREIEINKLNEADYNPRISLEPGMRDYENLKNSIEAFGDVEPIVWNERTGNVVGGHQRLNVLKGLGRETATCYVVDLDESDEKILNLALNKIKGEWDYDKLEEVMKEIDDAVLTGFSADEVYVLMAENEDGIDEDYDFSEWEDGNYYGSYVITLKFPSNMSAARWCNSNGFEGQVKPGTNTTVIRIGDDDE